MDSAARLRALDPCTSFIVQAPAGSGKTELLTQRFLALLPTVEEPEQILALTFTRKAAQEMRHRILNALQQAQQQIPLNSPHQTQTRELANAALLQSNRYGWDILQHPQRLQITTFDAFCARIYQSIPRNEEAIFPNLTAHPEYCYQRAIQKWFDICREYPAFQESLETLLQQTQNRIDELFKQMISLLCKRDQWMHWIHDMTNASTQAQQENLQALATMVWDPWANCLPQRIQHDLIDLIQTTLTYLPHRDFECLKSWQTFATITTEQISALQSFLMTKDGSYRKKWNLTKKDCPKDIYADIQDKSTLLLEELEAHPDFQHLLNTLPHLPHPECAQVNVQTLQPYYQLLPILAACLHMEFAEQDATDFIYIAQQALVAMRESDIHLYFDAHLEHLLIDEFQDTSTQQIQFIEQLTIDWSSHPQRTLFVVGDPMQSIYRFRSADVGIFLKVQQQGLPQVQLEPLYLQQNFRSAPRLIHALNAQFEHIFPKQENIMLGGVSFRHAHPARPENPDSNLFAHYFLTPEAQTAGILEVIQEARLVPKTSVAILVRNRHQLPMILDALKAQNLPFQGVDLTALGKLPHIRDVWNITQLLLNPNERLHELVVLRSPFCGLSIDALQILAQASSKNTLFNRHHVSLVTPENQTRFTHVLDAIEAAKRSQFQKPFIETLQCLFQDLKIDEIFSTSQQQELRKFYDIIDTFCEKHTWPDSAQIQDTLDQTYIALSEGIELQVMTIHKSKGLEFDWVVIPNMGDANKPSTPNWFEWIPLSNPKFSLPAFCLSAHDEYVDLFKWYEHQHSAHENQRLCYVALTRAKSRLYLFDDKEKPQKNAFRSLFPTDFFQRNDNVATLAPAPTHDALKRRPISLQPTNDKEIETTFLGTGSPFHNAHEVKHLGIALHRLLQWICEHHPQNLEEIPWHLAQYHLTQHAIQTPLMPYIQQLISQFWHCPTGQWIKQKHEFEKNEYAILVKDEGIVRELILDRTFIEDKQLWIIDFKTSSEHTEAKPQYIRQLNHYATHMQKLYPHHHIHCGLYFLSSQHFHQWAFSETESLVLID